MHITSSLALRVGNSISEETGKFLNAQIKFDCDTMEVGEAYLPRLNIFTVTSTVKVGWYCDNERGFI